MDVSQKLLVSSTQFFLLAPESRCSRADHELDHRSDRKGCGHVQAAVASTPKKYDLFDDNISKVIYKNKVAIIDYNTMTSFVIEDLKFAKFEAKLFKLLFKFLKGR